MREQELRRSKGITLIALVITIIVLLILAGVTIAMLTGENGVLKKASDAKEQTEIAEAEEEIKLKVLETQAEHDGTATLEQIAKTLEDDTGNTYLIRYTKRTASLDTEGDVTTSTDLSSYMGDVIYVSNIARGHEVKVEKIGNSITVAAVGRKVATGGSGGSGGSGESGGGGNPSSKPAIPEGKQIGTADKLLSGYCLYDENDNLIEGTYEAPTAPTYPAYTKGQTVTINNNGTAENFYVIADSDSGKATVNLLAYKCLNTSTLKQVDSETNVKFIYAQDICQGYAAAIGADRGSLMRESELNQLSISVRKLPSGGTWWLSNIGYSESQYFVSNGGVTAVTGIYSRGVRPVITAPKTIVRSARGLGLPALPLLLGIAPSLNF